MKIPGGSRKRQSHLEMGIASLVLSAVCCTFLLRTEIPFGGNMILALIGKYELFGIAEITFWSQFDIVRGKQY